MNSKLLTKKSLAFSSLVLVLLITGAILLNVFAVKPYIKVPSENSESNNTQPSEELDLNRKITEDGFVYYVLKTDDSEKFVSITKYEGMATDVKIPSTIEGYQVKMIDNTCFSYCDKIVSVEIPKEVKEISDFVFAGCHALEKVIIHSEEILIGQYINIDSSFAIVAPKGSDAEKYSKENNIEFITLNEK